MLLNKNCLRNCSKVISLRELTTDISVTKGTSWFSSILIPVKCVGIAEEYVDEKGISLNKSKTKLVAYI